MKYIFARNYEQGLFYTREKKLKHREYVIIQSYISLRGITIEESDEIVRCGTWYERPDLSEIEQELQICRRPYATS